MHKVFMFLLFYLFTVALTSDKKYKAGFSQNETKGPGIFRQSNKNCYSKKIKYLEDFCL